MAAGMELVDDIVLRAYSNIPRPTRNYITKVLRRGFPADFQTLSIASVEDEAPPDVYVHVRGSLHRAMSVLNKRITILSVDMTRPSPKRFVKLFQAIRDECPILKVLIIGEHVESPMRLDKRNEKKFCKEITALIRTCPELQHIDIRDILMTRPMYSVLCDLYNLKSLSATLVWDEVAPVETDTVCKDKLANKITFLRSLDLMCFKQYSRRFRGPTVAEMRALTVPREGVMCGLSAKLDTPDVEWVFNCDKLVYLDLEVTSCDLLEPKAAKLWNQFLKLKYLKLYASGKKAHGVPPLRKLESLTHLVLDSQVREPDWHVWYEKNMPDSLEFGAFFGVKRLQRDMFDVIAKATPVLRQIYIGYSENNPDSMLCPSVKPPRDLRYALILKDNNLDTANNHHSVGALYLKKKMDRLIFKLDSFERPHNSRMPVVWRDFMRRLHFMRTHQIVLNWRIDALREEMFSFIDCNDVTPDMKREESDSSDEPDSEGLEEDDTDDSSDD